MACTRHALTLRSKGQSLVGHMISRYTASMGLQVNIMTSPQSLFFELTNKLGNVKMKICKPSDTGDRHNIDHCS